jgi:hypothetical protein
MSLPNGPWRIADIIHLAVMHKADAERGRTNKKGRPEEQPLLFADRVWEPQASSAVS